MFRQPASGPPTRNSDNWNSWKRDCDELIDEMLSCSGGTAEQQRYEVTAGDSLASPATPDACSGGTAGQQQITTK